MKFIFFHKKTLQHLLFYNIYSGMLQPFVWLQSNLLLCWHGFCDVKVTLSKSMKSRPSMYSSLIPRNWPMCVQIAIIPDCPRPLLSENLRFGEILYFDLPIQNLVFENKK